MVARKVLIIPVLKSNRYSSLKNNELPPLHEGLVTGDGK